MEWNACTTELAPGIFMYEQAPGGLCIANAGIIAGRDGALVVDALFTPSMTRALLDETARVAAQPVRTLIDTHHHVDHTLGNALFSPQTTIVAHERAKAEMERSGLRALDIIRRLAPHFAPELEHVSERLPDSTFGGASLDLDFDGRLLRLLHFGTGHTRGDVLVHLPEQRLLFAGDVAFFGVTPLAHEGHIGKWLGVIDRVIEEVDAETIVPGHGPPGTKDDLRRLAGYFELLRDAARRAFDAGATEDEALHAIDLGEYAEWQERERISANVARLYQEFRGELADW